MSATSPDVFPAPAVRSTLDVALWFIARAEAEGLRLSAARLHLLLFAAQAAYAGGRGGRKLMPATFVAGAEGPVEPTVMVALESGLREPPRPAVPPEIEEVLAALWRRCGAMPAVALGRLLASEGWWPGAGAVDPGSELPIRRRPRQPPPSAPVASPSPPRRPEVAEVPSVRFTLDGREVRKWTPRRRIAPDGSG